MDCKTRLIVIFILAMVVIGCSPKITPTSLTLTSTVVEQNGKIPSTYTCDGANINPPLSISNIPVGTKSLVLIMEDPDAVKVTGKVWNHWLVWNIPAETTAVKEGKEPLGVHGKGTGGNTNYFGPCPPEGEHRYFFKVYALDSMLTLEEGSTKQEVVKAMERHILAQGELIGTYNR